MADLKSSTVSGDLRVTGVVSASAYYPAGSLTPGDTYPITASYAVTASYAMNGGGPGGPGLETGSSYPITASWAESASWAPGGTLPENASFETVTASRALRIGVSADNTACFYVSCSAMHGSIMEIDRFDGAEIFNISNSGSLSIGTPTLTAGAPETLRVNSVTIGSYNIATFVGSVNNYLQLNLTNSNKGATASSDIVATNDIGNEFSYYVDMGINGSNYATNFIGHNNDAYLYTTGSDFYIGNTTPNASLCLFAGGTASSRSIEITSQSIKCVVPLLATSSHALSASWVSPVNTFSRGAAFVDWSGLAGSAATINILPTWRAAMNCTLTGIYTNYISGTGATITARKNLTTYFLTASAAATTGSWAAFTQGLTNTSIAAGDAIDIILVSSSGYPVVVAVQMDFVRN